MFLRWLNPLLGVIWLTIGVAVLLTDWRRGIPTFYFTIFGTPISLGWLALALAGYNVIRWWSVRSWLARKNAMEDADTWRRQRHARSERRPPQEPDPNFIFTDTRPLPPDRDG